MDELNEKLDDVEYRLEKNYFNMHNLNLFLKVFNSEEFKDKDVMKVSHDVLFKGLGVKFKNYARTNEEAQQRVVEKMKKKYKWEILTNEKRKEMSKSPKIQMEQLFLLSFEYLVEEKKKMNKDRDMLLNAIEKEREITLKALLGDYDEPEPSPKITGNIMNETMNLVYEKMLELDMNIQKDSPKSEDVSESEWLSTESIIKRLKKN
jgi:hypothetical protein